MASPGIPHKINELGATPARGCRSAAHDSVDEVRPRTVASDCLKLRGGDAHCVTSRHRNALSESRLDI
jgi:hypothetical protein